MKKNETVLSIFRKNIFTYFNLIFAVITVLLVIAGSFRSLTFLPVIILNTALGIFHQLRSKKVLDDLNLLAKASYDVVVGNEYISTPIDELKLNDVILLKEGQQIPADGVLVEGKISANESLLTGESDEIDKIVGSEIKSGSFVVTGKCKAKLTAVGEDSYAAKLTQKAKEIKDKKSELIKNVELIIKIAGIVIIPVGIALYLEAIIINKMSYSDAIVSMVGAVIGMIPEGLYLLLTVALALGAMYLARKKVLLHDMRSIETLARIDTLCVDKTGTITSNSMNVEEIIPANDNVDEEKKLLARYVNTVEDANITMLALKEYFGNEKAFENADIVPFTSKLKYSQVKTNGKVYRFGAPEILLSKDTLNKYDDILKENANKGLRVLAFVKVNDEGECLPLLFVSLKNGIRKNAVETFSYFKKQGVDVMVISGDNPLTVSKIAKQVGIPNYDKYVDASTLTTDKDIEDATLKYTIFGRVKPEQKKDIVLALKKHDKKVAMTGDGVNDILAMKEADCSIAMGSGSDAARQAAQVVLLDSDFSKMRDIVSRGRQIINNITRSAVLFLFKNLFSIMLALFSIITIANYPLVPSQVSLVTMFNTGVSGFLLSLEPNIKKQRQSFFKKIFLTAGPAALIGLLSIAMLMKFSYMFDISKTSLGVMSTYMLEVAGFMVLFQIARPFNLYRAVITVGCFFGFVIVTRIPILRNLYMISDISSGEIRKCIMLAIIEVIIIGFVHFLLKKKIRNI